MSLGRPVGVPEGRPLVTEGLLNDAPQRSFGRPHRRYNLGSLIAYVCSNFCATRRPNNSDSHGCLANLKHVGDCAFCCYETACFKLVCFYTSHDIVPRPWSPTHTKSKADLERAPAPIQNLVGPLLCVRIAPAGHPHSNSPHIQPLTSKRTAHHGSDPMLTLRDRSNISRRR